MSWFTDWTIAPEIIHQEVSYTERIGGVLTNYERTITEAQKTIEGLTVAAARAGAATFDADPNVTATVERANQANGYRLRITEVTRGAWEAA